MKKVLSLILALCLILSCAAFVSAEEDYVYLTWAIGNEAPKDAERANAALNELLHEKIGVDLTMYYFTNDELALATSAGEVYDIYFTCSWYNNTNQAISQGLFLGLTQEEIAEKAPGLYAALSKEVWDLAESDDGYIYAIPNKKDYAAENFLTYDADVAAELGFEIPDEIESWDDMTDFLVAWKETLAEDEYVIYIGGGFAGMDSDFDFIDRTVCIGCEYGTTTVMSVYQSEEILERYRTIAKWYELGLINADAATAAGESFDDSVPFMRSVQAWDNYNGYTISWGWNVGMTKYFGPNLSVDSVQGSMNAFSVTLKDNEEKLDAALALFELLHTDKLVADTMRYGEQGYHWYYVEDETNPCYGCVVQTEAGSSGFGVWGFAQPQYFFTSLACSEASLTGEAAAPNLDQYEVYYANVAENACVSAMGGFKWDSSAWTQQINEISAIKDQYSNLIGTGTVCIDDVYDEMMAKMFAAGLQDMIDDAQAQLDEYLANH